MGTSPQLFFLAFFELTCAGFIQIIHRRLFHQCGRFQKVNISSYYNPGQNILELKTEGLSKLGNIKKNPKSVCPVLLPEKKL